MSTRTLFYFPVVHSEIDLGGLQESVRQIHLEKVGKVGWQRKVVLVKQFWQDVEAILAHLTLPVNRTRLYQDGLPVCGREADIVDELARKGSLNHRLLQRLMDRGATLMGTESAELLLAEYHLSKLMLAGADGSTAAATDLNEPPAGDRLLAARDAFIAARIARTLQSGETGVLFLGMLHNPCPGLPADIEVIWPMHRPGA